MFKLGRIQSAIDHYCRILQFKPNRIDVLNDLAWIWATTEDTKLRNPTEAAKFAQRACELTDYKQPAMLDTLAAAYAAVGRFPEAVAIAKKALELAQSSQLKELTEEIRNRIRLYKAAQPYIEPLPKASSD